VGHLFVYKAPGLPPYWGQGLWLAEALGALYVISADLTRGVRGLLKERKAEQNRKKQKTRDETRYAAMQDATREGLEEGADDAFERAKEDLYQRELQWARARATTTVGVPFPNYRRMVAGHYTDSGAFMLTEIHLDPSQMHQFQTFTGNREDEPGRIEIKGLGTVVFDLSYIKKPQSNPRYTHFERVMPHETERGPIIIGGDFVLTGETPMTGIGIWDMLDLRGDLNTLLNRFIHPLSAERSLEIHIERFTS
jgi:hypothetical protein